jgi:carboxyl-terminal processing protease
VGLVALAARERSGPAQRFGEVVGAIERGYFQHVDGDALFVAAVEGAVATLDENSAYLRDAGRDELEAALDQRFGGIGLELALDAATAQPVVVAPVYRSPAWRAGISAGDLVTAIDGVPTQGRPLRDSVQRLRGRVGENVGLTVLPATPPAETLDPAAGRPAVEPREVSLARELVEVESVQGDRRRADGSWEWMLEGEPGVAYVRIASFGERTAAEFSAAVEAIAGAATPRGLVLDLRDNPGGLLQCGSRSHHVVDQQETSVPDRLDLGHLKGTNKILSPLADRLHPLLLRPASASKQCFALRQPRSLGQAIP